MYLRYFHNLDILIFHRPMAVKVLKVFNIKLRNLGFFCLLSYFNCLVYDFLDFLVWCQCGIKTTTKPAPISIILPVIKGCITHFKVLNRRIYFAQKNQQKFNKASLNRQKQFKLRLNLSKAIKKFKFINSVGNKSFCLIIKPVRVLMKSQLLINIKFNEYLV